MTTETVAEPSTEEIEAAAKGIWSLVAYPSWMTWEDRIKAEKAHRGDKSWGGMTNRCREYARAALMGLRAAETPIPENGDQS